MKRIVLILFLVLSASAQSVSDKASNTGTSATPKKVDAKLHADAIRLVEVSGAKQRLQGSLKQMTEEGRKQMMEKCSSCMPAFGDEWEKRMLQRIKVDDFLDVYVRVYEKYFTDEELNELIAIQSATRNSQAAEPSSALKEKLAAVMPSVMGDAIGGCSQIGAKLGAEIGGEIEKEHPEYVRAKTQPDSSK